MKTLGIFIIKPEIYPNEAFENRTRKNPPILEKNKIRKRWALTIL